MFRLHQAIQLLVIMIQLSFEAASLRHK